MNTTEIDAPALKDTVAEQPECALKELQQLQLAIGCGCLGETILM